MSQLIQTTVIFLLLCIVLPAYNGVSHELHPIHSKIELLQPSGEEMEGLPVMVRLPDTSELYVNTMQAIEHSFILEFLDIYKIARIYLNHIDPAYPIEPAYLALTENMGGYARYGFCLSDGSSKILKPESPYVDITGSRATSDINKLMSFSQLFPHEMGHVMLKLLCKEDTVAYNSKSVNIHFFSVITDFSTAFNEGFAEHMENVSRKFEKNQAIRAGIEADTRKIEMSSVKYINGFEKDFQYPFRLGFYKASMIIWYQKYEDYKRYVQATNGDIRFKSSSIDAKNLNDVITYRNAGLKLDKELKNMVQLHATEGVISAFFTRILTSTLPDHYLDKSFYIDFLDDSTKINQDPKDVFSPLENQFIKYFKVLHEFVVFNNSSNSQLNDFVEGYIMTFPSEADQIKNIYSEVTGIKFGNMFPPPLWLMVNDFDHRLLVFDPFDAITVPLYTFDLNAAEIADLLTIKGLTKPEAEKIISHRKQYGYFSDFEEVRNIQGITEETADKLINTSLVEEHFENKVKDLEAGLKLGILIQKPIQHLITRTLIHFLIIFIFLFIFTKRKVSITLKNGIMLFLRYLLLWILFVVSGMAILVLTSKPVAPFILFSLGVMILVLLLYRKNRFRFSRSIMAVLIMGIFIYISIV